MSLHYEKTGFNDGAHKEKSLLDNSWVLLGETEYEGELPITKFIKNFNGVPVVLTYDYEGKYNLTKDNVVATASSLDEVEVIAQALSLNERGEDSD